MSTNGSGPELELSPGLAKLLGLDPAQEPKRRGRPRKQQEIPGTEPKRIEAIDAAAREYRGIRDERMKLTMQEIESREHLAKVMREHKLALYKYRDETEDDGEQVFEVVLESKEKAKVRREGAKKAPEDSE